MKPPTEVSLQNSTALEASQAAPSSYRAASEQELELTLFHMRLAIARIAYLKVTRAAATGPKAKMVQMRVVPNGAKVTAEMIEADLRHVWASEVVRSEPAVYHVVGDERSLAFRFAILYRDGIFLTGTVEVDLSAKASRCA